MTTNKMPEMPPVLSYEIPPHDVVAHSPEQMRAFSRESAAFGFSQGFDAGYLAGLEAARQAVPPSAQKVGEDSYEIILPALTVTITTAASMGWNTAVLTSLANLTALEQEAKK